MFAIPQLKFQSPIKKDNGLNRKNMIFISFKVGSLSILLPELSISLWVGLNEESPPVDICNYIWPCNYVCVVHVNEESSPMGVCNCIRPCICICVIYVSGLASLLRGGGVLLIENLL